MANTKASEATKKAADSIKKTAEKTVDVTVEKATIAKKAVEKAVEESAKKAADKVPAAKETAKKAIAETKETVKSAKRGRPAKAKKAAPVEETFFEFEGTQIMAEDIVAKVKEAYKAEGHRVGSIKSLRTYINAHERKAYYVINGKAENKYVEF